MPTEPKPTAKGRPQVAIRLDPEQIAEIDRLAERASTPLRAITRADVARRALELGLAALRAEIEGKRSRKPAR